MVEVGVQYLSGCGRVGGGLNDNNAILNSVDVVVVVEVGVELGKNKTSLKDLLSNSRLRPRPRV